MLINVHTHIIEGQDVKEWYECQQMEAADVTVVFGDFDKCSEAAEAFPNRVIPFGQLDGDNISPQLVDEFNERGFKGIKMIATPLAYDDPAYYPIYEKAAEYDMPILFHTGHLVVRDYQTRRTISVGKMAAFRLDGIARAFPELNLIGAHLGNPRWEEACSIAKKHPGVYFDLSGGTARKLPFERWRLLLMTGVDSCLGSFDEKLDLSIVNKFVFGSDGAVVPTILEFYENLFNAFDFPQETREKIMWRNAAKMLGITEELEKQEK